MNKEYIKQVIENTADSVAQSVVIRLKKEKFIKTGRTPFQKVEALLYSYSKFKDIISDKLAEIDMIREHGLKKKSKSVTFFSGGSFKENESEFEQVEKAIEKIREDIVITEYAIAKIDSALDSIKDDKYFDVIWLRYIEGKTIESIAEDMNRDVTTIYRNKSRLINELKIILFTDETILELMN